MFNSPAALSRLGLPLLATLVVACSSARVGETDAKQPVIVFPANFAEGSQEGKIDPDATAAKSQKTTSGVSTGRSLPDPPAVSAIRQWEYKVTYDQGNLTIDNVRAVELDAPALSARRMGRYALELWIGDELLERVRFEFPLVEPPKDGVRRPLREPPQFGPGLVMSKRVRLPDMQRATSARLVDRATGKFTKLPWPPASATAKPASPKPAATSPGSSKPPASTVTD